MTPPCILRPATDDDWFRVEIKNLGQWRNWAGVGVLVGCLLAGSLICWAVGL